MHDLRGIRYFGRPIHVITFFDLGKFKKHSHTLCTATAPPYVKVLFA
jgi:hypothetical protein